MPSPRRLARAYDDQLTASWSGDTLATWEFAIWLASKWIEPAPPEPAAAPAAVSHVGFAGPGVRWYAVGDVILGYAPGRPGGCYRVPRTAALPAPGVHGDIGLATRKLHDRSPGGGLPGASDDDRARP